MAIKKFPISQERLEEIIKEYPTPFHIYDEKAIRANLRRFKKAFDWAPEARLHRIPEVTYEYDCSELKDLESLLAKNLQATLHKIRERV